MHQTLVKAGQEIFSKRIEMLEQLMVCVFLFQFFLLNHLRRHFQHSFALCPLSTFWHLYTTCNTNFVYAATVAVAIGVVVRLKVRRVHTVKALTFAFHLRSGFKFHSSKKCRVHNLERINFQPSDIHSYAGLQCNEKDAISINTWNRSNFVYNSVIWKLLL